VRNPEVEVVLEHPPFVGLAAITGVGATPQGKLPGRTGDDLAIEALRLAVDDAGLHKADIDGLIVQESRGGQGDLLVIGHRLGLEPRFSMQVAHHADALWTAIMSVSSGLCRHVALTYGTNQKTAQAKFTAGTFHGDQRFDPLYGLANPGSTAALDYRRRMVEFGATEEQLGTVAIAQSKAAAANPLAVYRDVLTIDDYLAAQYVIEPLRLYDFCMISDGGFAVIVSPSSLAKHEHSAPVVISGFGSQSSFLEYEHPDAAFSPSQRRAAEMLWQSTQVTPSDVRALYVQDAYSPTVLAAIENYGFCGVGTAHEWIQGGRIALGGELPVNPNGGQSRMTYMVGWQNTYDAVKQLRGEAETKERQLPGLGPILCTYSHGQWQRTWAMLLERG
jgi:acetyl-CoA acetyltransferase